MGIREYLIDFINLNLNDYPNIRINLEINKLLLCILIGSIAATVLISYLRSGMTSLVRSILRRDARTPEKAKTLEELKLNSLSVKYAITKNQRIIRLVKRVGAKEYTYEEYCALSKNRRFKEEKIDLKEARFYIPEESSDEAKRIYERKEISLINTVLFSLMLVIIFGCIGVVMPEILSLLDAFLAK